MLVNMAVDVDSAASGVRSVTQAQRPQEAVSASPPGGVSVPPGRT